MERVFLFLILARYENATKILLYSGISRNRPSRYRSEIKKCLFSKTVKFASLRLFHWTYKRIFEK